MTKLKEKNLPSPFKTFAKAVEKSKAFINLKREASKLQKLLEPITDKKTGQIVIKSKDQKEYAISAAATLGGVATRWDALWAEPLELAGLLVSSLRERRAVVSDPAKEAKENIKKALRVFIALEEEKEAEQQAKLDKQTKKDRDVRATSLRERIEEAEADGDRKLADTLKEQLAELDEDTTPVRIETEKTTHTEEGSASKTKAYEVSVLNKAEFIAAMLQQHPDALDGIIDVKKGPLKAFVKANKMKKFPGLSIREFTDVTIRENT